MCHSKRSICDLKQSSGSWYSRFHKSILAYLCFQKAIVYVKRSTWDCVPDVDDIPLTRNNLEMIKATKR